jgi:hypothetical protein
MRRKNRRHLVSSYGNRWPSECSCSSAKIASGHAEVLFDSILQRKMEIVEVSRCEQIDSIHTDIVGENSRKRYEKIVYAFNVIQSSEEIHLAECECPARS